MVVSREYYEVQLCGNAQMPATNRCRLAVWQSEHALAVTVIGNECWNIIDSAGSKEGGCEGRGGVEEV